MIFSAKPEPETERLDELDKDEWFSDCLRSKPSITAQEFETIWLEFIEYQRFKSLN